MNRITIPTARLVLKPLGPEFLETTNAYALDPENTRYMLFLPNRDPEETLSFLKAAAAEWEKEDPAYYQFAILYEGRHIGAVSLDLEEGGGELGWILHRDWWGNGFAPEAARAVVEYFSGKGCTHFIAHCDTENTASWRVMEKLGMTRTAEYGGRKNRADTKESMEYRYELTVSEAPGEGSRR